MTEVQSMMLAICFGAVMGTNIANLVFIVKCAIDSHKEKKRKLKEEQNNQ